MDISVSSRHLAVSDELHQYAESKIGRLGKYLGGMDRAEVHFSEERNPRISAKERCEVTMHGHGHVVRARVAAHDQFAAVDLVFDYVDRTNFAALGLIGVIGLIVVVLLVLASIEDATLIQYLRPASFSSLFRLFGQAETQRIQVDLGVKLPQVRAGIYFLAPQLAR